MRNTVLLLLLVVFASAAPVADDADEQNILQMLQNADPYENDILNNNDIELPNSNVYEKESQEEMNSEIVPTTEYTFELKSETDTDSSQEFETESDTDLNLKPIVVVKSAPEEQSNNTTSLDLIIETEQQLEPNFDTELVKEPNNGIDVEYTQFYGDLAPMIIESPQYSIKFPEVIPELEATDLNKTIIEDGIYSNEEWPQRYAPDFPDIPENQQLEQGIFNMEDNPQIPINTFGTQVFPEGYIPENYDSSAIGPMGSAYQAHNEQFSGHFIDTAPFVDAWTNTYPNPETFSSNPEVNQFVEDGMAHEMIDDITIEPIYYDQVPKFYDDTPESPLYSELPFEMLVDLDDVDNSNENSEDRIELIVIDKEMSEIPFTPIAEEVEQPQDSLIIPTAILQDTRPDVELLGLFGDSGDAVVIEEIEEKTYPLDEEDFVEGILPASEVSPNETFDQDDVIIGNSNLPVTEDEIALNPFSMMSSLIGDIEQVTVPDMPIVQEPTLTVLEDDQFLFDMENNQRIYYDDKVRENVHIFPQTFQSNPEFMVPQVHDQFPFGIENYQPHAHNENIDYHGDILHTNYHDDIPHNHNGHQFGFDNAPHNHYFDDISGSRKRDGAHIVPVMDNMEMPIIEMGEMEIFNSPMMGPANPRVSPQITVILVSKPQEVKRVWSQFIRPMQQKPFSPVDISLSQVNLKDLKEVSQTQHRFNNEIQGNGANQFGNMGQFPQSPNTNQFNQNFYGQNFNEQPMQNYNAYQKMNLPQNQLFNSGMSPFTPNFNQQPNMDAMFHDLDMDLTLEDLELIQLEDMERQSMFASQQPSSPYGPSMFSFSKQQQTWPTRYAPNYQENNFGNNGQFYPQQNINRPFFIPS